MTCANCSGCSRAALVLKKSSLDVPVADSAVLAFTALVVGRQDINFFLGLGLHLRFLLLWPILVQTWWRRSLKDILG